MRHRKVLILLFAVVVVSLGVNDFIPTPDSELDNNLKKILSHISVRATSNYQKGFKQGYRVIMMLFKDLKIDMVETNSKEEVNMKKAITAGIGKQCLRHNNLICFEILHLKPLALISMGTVFTIFL